MTAWHSKSMKAPSTQIWPASNGGDDALEEEKFIAGYVQLTGASRSLARSVYMFADVLRGHYFPLVNGESKPLAHFR